MTPTRRWEEFWENEAPTDFMRLDWQFTHPARQLVYKTASGMGNSVLDVGCGTGIDYMGFLMNFMNYVGVDITPKFVARFKELHPEADVRVHSSLSLPFPDKSFDVVYSGGMIQHQHPDDYPTAIREMWRTCRNGLILTTSKPFTKKNDVIQLVRKNKVFDNHYGMPGFLKVVRALPKFKTIKLHKNIKHVNGEPYTVVVIMKDVKR